MYGTGQSRGQGGADWRREGGGGAARPHPCKRDPAGATLGTSGLLCSGPGQDGKGKRSPDQARGERALESRGQGWGH